MITDIITGIVVAWLIVLCLAAMALIQGALRERRRARRGPRGKIDA